MEKWRETGRVNGVKGAALRPVYPCPLGEKNFSLPSVGRDVVQFVEYEIVDADPSGATYTPDLIRAAVWWVNALLLSAEREANQSVNATMRNRNRAESSPQSSANT